MSEATALPPEPHPLVAIYLLGICLSHSLLPISLSLSLTYDKWGEIFGRLPILMKRQIARLIAKGRTSHLPNCRRLWWIFLPYIRSYILFGLAKELF